MTFNVADDGTVVRTLRERNGRHYAFRWRNRRLLRLDDLPHHAGWRFESAYAVPSEYDRRNRTFNGIAAVFTRQA